MPRNADAGRIVDEGTQPSGSILSGRVVGRAFLGSTARYTVDTPHGTMTVDDTAHAERPSGGAVTLSVEAGRLHLLPA